MDGESMQKTLDDILNGTGAASGRKRDFEITHEASEAYLSERFEA